MSKINEKKINELLNQKGKELLGEAFEGVGGVVCTPAINKLQSGFTSFKKTDDKIEEDSKFDKVSIPTGVNRFLVKFVQAMKDSNMSRIKRAAVLYKVIEASGLSVSQLMQDINKIKRELD